ncbi:MAG: ABC transporter substrate-binding protein, partial [Nitrososphaerales archaeon]
MLSRKHRGLSNTIAGAAMVILLFIGVGIGYVIPREAPVAQTITVTNVVTQTVTQTRVETTTATVTATQPAIPIKIGFSAPLTGAGAFYGQQALWGAQMAVDEINARGGVLNRQLTLIAED